jgi:hypothetical protein
MNMMEYNTERNKLVIKEYGRNVQKMIEYTIQIEDDSTRLETAKAIVKIMAQINPEQKENMDPLTKQSRAEDYWRKLWDHLFIISDFKLDIEAPFPKPEPILEPAKVTAHVYQREKITFRTYGRNMEQIIKVVSTYPEEQRKNLGILLANHLKKLYLLHNRNTVKDILIIDHLRDLSGGKIDLPNTLILEQTRDLLKGTTAQFAKTTMQDAYKKKKKKKKKPFIKP